MQPKRLSSPTLVRYQRIEKCLAGFFRLFENLCDLCFAATLIQIDARRRDKIQHWCCCLVDNQVRDHWEPLDAIQRSIHGPSWFKRIKQQNEAWTPSIPRCRTGNGPCLALCGTGCLIRQGKPAVCTTHVCEKMIFVLVEAGICKMSFSKGVQMHEIIGSNDIVRLLYGGANISDTRIEEYIHRVEDLKRRFGRVSVEQRRALAALAAKRFLE